MAELRWHPLLQEWVAVASQRQGRTFLPPAAECPFCPPGPGGDYSEVPHGDWDVAVFENRFSALGGNGAPELAAPPYSRVEPARGTCEVVLYTPRHEGSLGDLSDRELAGLVDVWTDRTRVLGEREDVAYVYVFENRGPAVGVTLTHPHGQIYGLPIVPPKLAQEARTVDDHLHRTGRCLLCAILAHEVAHEARIVLDADGWLIMSPYAARFPYELQVVPRHHRGSLTELPGNERRELGALLGRIVRGYDRLWDQPMPYMMLVAQRPVDEVRHDGFHLHVDFLPIGRAAGRLKYLASVETGAGVFLADMSAESAAERLRAVI